MTQKTIFFHGWSYDPQFWHVISLQNIHECEFYDRGYYGAYHKPELGSQSNRAITHSMGLLFLTQEYDIKKFDDIIIYAGFTKFPNQVAPKAMYRGLKQNPVKIIHDFQQACGYQMPFLLENMNIQQLADDLLLLQKIDISNLLSKVSYTAYHGTEDKIVTSPLSNAILLPHQGHLCGLHEIQNV